jgi:uncharacterized protein YoxC
MKNIIVFFLIFSFIFFEISPLVIYAQSSQISFKDYLIPQCGLVGIEGQTSQAIDEEQLNQCAQRFSFDVNSIKSCVSVSGVNIQCVTSKLGTTLPNLSEVLSCLEEAVPEFGFLPFPIPGTTKGGFNFKDFINILGVQLFSEALGNFISSGLRALGLGGLVGGKVPTNDEGAQSIIGKSIEETAKNFTTQLQTAINLGIADVKNYLAFKIRSTLEGLIYNRILKNFIPDIEKYRYFRMYQAYTRAVDKLLAPYTQQSNVSCLPVEVKACVFNILNKASENAELFINRSENPKLAKRIFKSLAKTKRFEILNKSNCDPQDPQTFQIYQALGLTPKIIVANNGTNLTAQIKPTQSLIAQANQQKLSLVAKINNLFANPFQSFNLRSLLGQAGPTDIDTNQPLIDAVGIIDNAIEQANCNLIFNTSTAKIFQELEDELQNFNAYQQEPGATTFKPKTACLKTDAEAKIESLSAQLTEVEKKYGTTSIEAIQLKNTIDQLKKIRDEQRKVGITGESPFCVQKDEIKNPISVYEDLKQQISKGTFEFFNNREGATNVFVSFIRGWIDSQLFKLIDKGFGDLNKESSSNLFVQSNLENAYSLQRIEESCGRLKNSGVAGLEQSCRNILFEQRAALMNMTKFDLQNKLTEIQGVFKLINDLQNKINTYSATITEGVTTVTLNYRDLLQDNAASILGDLANSDNELRAISSNLSTALSEFQNIFNFTEKKLDQINNTLQQLENSPLAQRINNLNQELTNLQNRINQVKQDIQNKLNDLQNEAQNPKFISLFQIANYDYNSVRIKYPRNYHSSHYYDRFPFNIEGESQRFKLGEKEELSFYSYFYPKLINILAAQNLNSIYDNGRRIHFSYRGGENTSPAVPYIVYDLISKILAILYNYPRQAVETQQQQNLLAALNSHFNKFFNNTEGITIDNNDINKLEAFFSNLESVSTRTLRFVNNNSSVFPEIFTLVAQGSGGGQEVDFNLKETLNLFVSLSSKYKDIMQKIKANDIVKIQNDINRITAEIASTTEEYNKQINEILTKSGIDKEEIERNYNKIQELNNQLNEIDQQINSLCNTYNSTLMEAEAIINANLRNTNNNQPPADEESGSGGGETGQNNFGKRLAKVVKSLVGNALEPLSFLLKPKKIQIK